LERQLLRTGRSVELLTRCVRSEDSDDPEACRLRRTKALLVRRTDDEQSRILIDDGQLLFEIRSDGVSLALFGEQLPHSGSVAHIRKLAV
jgi:hypothetical protein